MLSFITAVDKLSTWVGHAFAWCIMGMTLGVGYEVFVRYVLRDPTSWAFDLSYIMYGALFMMGGAYTLSRDGHVRGDVFYRTWRPRTQATVELILYFIFFFPGVLALIIAGGKFAHQSILWKEVSSMSPANVPIFHFKLIIPAAGILLLIQGLAQVARCILCIREGAWPGRIADVEETETVLQHQAEDHERLEQSIDLRKGDGR
ncbi:MAG: TRAP transporter small permease subunit [Pseudomonadota bacterium]